jgi:enamine deaminase RidA (YjgF/YER057c/UK114 family)
MAKKIITPPTLVAPRGFAHGIATSGGTTLWLGGQDASDAQGKIIAGGLVAQMDQVLRNIQAVVQEAGGQMSDIVKLTIFVADRDDYLAQSHELRSAWRPYFGDYYPALALFQVSAFFQKEALIEIEGFAVIPAHTQTESAE